jgi:SNF2 family DNA or RNA helicase
MCQIIETATLWDEMVCTVLLQDTHSVVRIPASRLQPLAETTHSLPDAITYAAAAARVADALTHDTLLAPIESAVIPLPHQVWALSRAVAHERVRYLLADEVGLGKTIEAGLIMRELKLRGLVSRTLVIAPKGIVTQWVAEMRLHFNEAFQLVLPQDISTLGRVVGSKPGSTNPWEMFAQVVVPMDSVKPLDKRRGWTDDQVTAYNQERYESLVSAAWDMVIVDEAHRLGGSSDQIARFKLGQGLSGAAPYLLFLSATPHQGKTDAFFRLVSLLDAQEFPDIGSVSRERVQPYVIRTEKRRATDADGAPLFKPRRTELAPVAWKERHHAQQVLYEAVTEYVREGYNQAMRQRRRTIGFLMILMQRLVVSSTAAIRDTLQRRMEVLSAESELDDTPEKEYPAQDNEEPFYDMDGEEQIAALAQTRVWARRNELDEVRLLLDAAERCEQAGPDAKAEALLDWLYTLQSQESDPDLKAIIFTEFVSTQAMLARFLSERGFATVSLNGSMDIEARQQVQTDFAEKARILISTDAGGEGLNLQFCHVVINYDIPWNPMRLEQRIGRVDRIGQTHPVRAINLILEDSVERRVREILEQKLAVIFEEFGVDKTGDVLDTAQAGRLFDEMYVEAILHPDRVDEAVEGAALRVQAEMAAARESGSLLGAAEDLDPRIARELQAHPIPVWVEKMTTSYLQTHGGKAERRAGCWQLRWPEEDEIADAVFSRQEAELRPSAQHLTLDNPQIRELVRRLPRFKPEQQVPIVLLPGLARELHGIWSLWRISLTPLKKGMNCSKIGHR